MSGLDSIALAVAHLEERQKDSNPAILSRNPSDASANQAKLASSAPASAAVKPTHPSPASAVVGNSSPPLPPQALHLPPARVISMEEHSLKVAPVAAAAGGSSPSSSSSNSNNGSTFGYILADPIKWLQKTQDRPQLQPPSETALKVEPTDVLCGRGGETNHHPGNVQYRLLVKAFQPLYVSAKRRDKPLIARCIVYSVRQVGGRFLKRANDKEWKDVGNTKAREKTSQALREGAPELRGDSVPNKMIPKQQQQQPIMMQSPTPPPPPPQMPQAPAHQGQPMSFAEARFLSALLAQQAALTRSVVTGQHHHPHHPQQPPMSHHPMAPASILSQQQEYHHHHHHQQQQHRHQSQAQQLPPVQHLPPRPTPTSSTTNATTARMNEEENPRKRPAIVSEQSDSDSIGSNASDKGSSKGGPRLKRFKMRFLQEQETTRSTTP